MHEDYILEMDHISKFFPGVKALDDVSFALKKGEIHCLLGENGAGKSTLMKVLSGSYRPDEGSIKLNGEKVIFNEPVEAQRRGISMIHQELDLLPELSVMENVFLGHEICKKSGAIDWKKQLYESQSLKEACKKKYDNFVLHNSRLCGSNILLYCYGCKTRRNYS